MARPRPGGAPPGPAAGRRRRPGRRGSAWSTPRPVSGVLLTGLADRCRRAAGRPAPARRARDRLRHARGAAAGRGRGARRALVRRPLPARRRRPSRPTPWRRGAAWSAGRARWHVAPAGRGAVACRGCGAGCSRWPRAAPGTWLRALRIGAADRRTPAGLRLVVRRRRRGVRRPGPGGSSVGLLPVRLVVLVLVAGVALSAAFLGAAPPHWDVLAPRPATAGAGRRVAGADRGARRAVRHVRLRAARRCSSAATGTCSRPSGLTYAEYARSGFGQLVVVTLLTLSVVAATVRWAPQETTAAAHRPAAAARRALRPVPGDRRRRRSTGCTSTRRRSASPGCACS